DLPVAGQRLDQVNRLTAQWGSEIETGGHKDAQENRIGKEYREDVADLGEHAPTWEDRLKQVDDRCHEISKNGPENEWQQRLACLPQDPSDHCCRQQDHDQTLPLWG